MISVKLIASSMPGIAAPISFIMFCIGDSSPRPRASVFASEAMLAGSTSMQYRLENPLTRVGSWVKRWQNASLRLCAGSVDTISTFSRTVLSSTPRQHEVVVFPTPPLPPVKAHLGSATGPLSGQGRYPAGALPYYSNVISSRGTQAAL